MPKARSPRAIITAHRQLEGGGFPVRRPFPTTGLDGVDPFLLLDEMGPVDWKPGEAIGAPDHPHRGFETVTYLLEGETVHEDSCGHRATLGPGDVQWMTAGAGVVHSEMPSDSLLERGGRIHGFQIWVNLPASEKMIAPRYQDLPSGQMPTATSEDGLSRVRVIAGEAMGVSAALETRTPIVCHHWTLDPGASQEIHLSADHNVLIYLFGGSLALQPGGEEVQDGQAVIFGEGELVCVRCPESCEERAEFLLLAGRPIGEPISRYGPFVMNSFSEIRQAFLDYQLGRMGRIDRDEPA